MKRIVLFLLPFLTLIFSACLNDDAPDYPDTKLIKGQWELLEADSYNHPKIYRFTTDGENTWSWGGLMTYRLSAAGGVTFDKRYTWHVSDPANEHDGRPRLELTWYDAPESDDLWDATEYYVVTKLNAEEMWLKREQNGVHDEVKKFIRRDDLPKPPAWPAEGNPEESRPLPDEAKFKFTMYDVLPLNGLKATVPAPFDFLGFRILDHNGEYSFPDKPKFVEYYDSIVMTSPAMPDTYRVYSTEADENSSVKHLVSQFGSYFFEKSDFPIVFKGYKDGKEIYRTSNTQTMRERDFLGIDWAKSDITLSDPVTRSIYCVLDRRMEFRMVDIQEKNGTPYTTIYVRSKNETASGKELPEEQKALLQWLLGKYLGSPVSLSLSEFKTLPEGVDVVAAYTGSTTRAAILHQLADDSHAEGYYAIAEARK